MTTRERRKARRVPIPVLVAGTRYESRRVSSFEHLILTQPTSTMMLLRRSLSFWSSTMVIISTLISPSRAFQSLNLMRTNQQQLTRLFSTAATSSNVTSNPKAVTGAATATSTAATPTYSNTGGLRRLPVVKSPIELMDKARKAGLRVRADRYVVELSSSK
jgi:hypothetical protein